MTPGIPRVSVLLPCYDGERYIAEALQSIVDQSFRDFEIIFVDDGSQDSSLAIARDFAAHDSRMRIVSKENGGIVSALNAGLAICRGEYVARMDADDISLPDRFAQQVSYLNRHPACVGVGGFAVNAREELDLPIRTTNRNHRRTKLNVFPPQVASALHPLIMVRRSALMAIGGYRTGFTHAEDYDLYIRLRHHGTIDNPRHYMLIYRRHEDAISTRHIEIQEESAAKAEYDAMCQAGIAPPRRWLSDPYIRLRIWRRYQVAAPHKARTMRMRIVADLLNLNPRSVVSISYFRLRLLILAAVLRWAMHRNVRPWPSRELQHSLSGST